MNEEIHCITNKGITAKNELENDDSESLWATYSIYKKSEQFFFYTDSFNCLKKDSSVLLKVINIWAS